MTGRRVAQMLALALIGAGAGCAANQKYLDRRNGLGTPTTARLEDVPVHGADVLVQVTNLTEVEGELLAADPDGVTVLESTNDVTYIAADHLSEVEVRLYDAAAGWTGAWTGVGAASTLSHGLFLIFSLPIWVATGTTASIVANTGRKLHVAPNQIGALYQFARFPQGLPPGFAGRWNATRQHKATWLSTEPGQSTPPPTPSAPPPTPSALPPAPSAPPPPASSGPPPTTSASAPPPATSASAPPPAASAPPPAPSASAPPPAPSAGPPPLGPSAPEPGPNGPE